MSAWCWPPWPATARTRSGPWATIPHWPPWPMRRGRSTLFPPAICPGHQSGHRSGTGIDRHPVAHPSRSLAAHSRHQGANPRAFAGVAVPLSRPDARAAQSGAPLGRRDAAGGSGLRLCSFMQSPPRDRRSVRPSGRAGAGRGGHFACSATAPSRSPEPVPNCFRSPWPWPPGRCITRW